MRETVHTKIRIYQQFQRVLIKLQFLTNEMELDLRLTPSTKAGILVWTETRWMHNFQLNTCKAVHIRSDLQITINPGIRSAKQETDRQIGTEKDRETDRHIGKERDREM